jgi:hypothetical protein
MARQVTFYLVVLDLMDGNTVAVMGVVTTSKLTGLTWGISATLIPTSAFLAILSLQRPLYPQRTLGL